MTVRIFNVMSGDITQGTNYAGGLAPVSGDVAVLGGAGPFLNGAAVGGVTYVLPFFGPGSGQNLSVTQGGFGAGTELDVQNGAATGFFAGLTNLSGLMNVGLNGTAGILSVNPITALSYNSQGTLVSMTPPVLRMDGTINITNGTNSVSNLSFPVGSGGAGDFDATVTNAGLIAVRSGNLRISVADAVVTSGARYAGGTFTNTGTIAVLAANQTPPLGSAFSVTEVNSVATGSLPATLFNLGLITVTEAAGVAFAGRVTGANDFIQPAVYGNGTFAIDGNGNTGVLRPAFEFDRFVSGGQTLILTDATISLLKGFGTGSILFNDANGVLAVNNLANFSVGGVISGFQAGDAIDLGTNVYDQATGTGSKAPFFSAGILTLYSGGLIKSTLTFSGSFAANGFSVSSSSASDQILQVACYLRGTRLLTPSGEVAIETLRPGDRVVVANARQFARVRWIGQRTIDLRGHPSPASVTPVRILAGALGPGVPHRDLVVSPAHLMLIDGAFVRADALVNESSIRRDRAARQVTYFHIELEHHAVIVAEGAASETWLDTGNRAMFANAPVTDIMPDLSATKPGLACAPVLDDGPGLQSIRARLLTLAEGDRRTA